MKKRIKFTLLELLIVVAMIAMLVGLLLPALNSARAAARKITCNSNLKTYGIAHAQYAAAFDYLLPYMSRKTASMSSWIEQLYTLNDYFVSALGVKSYFYYGCNYWDVRLACPELPAARIKNLGGHRYSQAGVEYAMTMYASHWDGKGDSDIGFYAKASVLKRPSLIACFTENVKDFAQNGTRRSYEEYLNYLSALSSGSPVNLYAPMGYRHLRSLNIVFMDGHTQNMKEEQLMHDTRYTEMYHIFK